MNRNGRLALAEQTLAVIEKGYYHFGTAQIDVAGQIENNREQTRTYSPEALDALYVERQKRVISEETIVEVVNATSIEALMKEPDDKVAILNFASGRNPGGGFLGGSSAQEESLARSSSLYHALSKDMSMYEYNRNQHSYLYSDYMIYSPGTIFWFDDHGNALPAPVSADVITSPAPNKGAMIQNNAVLELQEIEETFLRRTRYIFSLAEKYGMETLILGAWGCGVFRNDPADVAACFRQVLEDEYRHVFKKIVFAVYDTSERKEHFNAFEQAFRSYR